MTMSTLKNNDVTGEPLRLTHIKPSFDAEELALASRQDLWHKFIVLNCQPHGKAEILKAIINACEPEILLPVMYKKENENKSTFLAKCNSGAIENLVKQCLCIALPGGYEIYIDIILGFINTRELSLNPNKVIAQSLYQRYESVKKILNLDDFENDRLLSSIFCPISIPKIFHLVLRCAKQGVMGNNRELKLSVRELSLKHNNLTAIILFEKFFNFHLTKLDLRYNQILDVEYLRYFSEFKITELWLDGNPLCTQYKNAQEYVQAVKNIFQHLQKLDGVIIGMEKKFIPNIQTHYLKDGSKLPLIKQFVKHFFLMYDQEDRSIMNGLYDKNAFYSMTLGAGTNYVHKQVAKSFVTNRNLLKFVDYAKCHEFLLRGPDKIISVLRRQPPTSHDIRTFNIDLLYESNNLLAISIQGLFYYKEISFLPMVFNRTFIIVGKEDNEYCITNDQYFIDGPYSNNLIQINTEMKHDIKNMCVFVPTIFSPSEKKKLIVFLQELTSMNSTFSLKFLEDVNWDIRRAITNFTKMYTLNDVPPEAFE
ncbi:nuclear RNA export factor 1-like isoform X1 [Vespa mandarinia]|uniref:nuclear RNA export factor 1-like isoform X1 n=1 Tax=Vespa mandarinia TaxID=7446 RepID=UPI0016197750|nr:nuclear RNA export factor 1-like isoform X1 [Vespa mandarinia]